MAFGFPAYHEEKIDLEIPRNEIISFLEPIIGSLSWSIRESTENHMLVKTKISQFSSRQKIRITILPSGSIQVRSENAIFTQCFDLTGKNKKNVHKLLSAINGI